MLPSLLQLPQTPVNLDPRSSIYPHCTCTFMTLVYEIQVWMLFMGVCNHDVGPPGCFESPTPGRATPSSAYAGGGCSPPASPCDASPGPAVSV